MGGSRQTGQSHDTEPAQVQAGLVQDLEGDPYERVSTGDQLDLLLARHIAVKRDPDVPLVAQVGRQLSRPSTGCLPRRGRSSAAPTGQAPRCR